MELCSELERDGHRARHLRDGQVRSSTQADSSRAWETAEPSQIARWNGSHGPRSAATRSSSGTRASLPSASTTTARGRRCTSRDLRRRGRRSGEQRRTLERRRVERPCDGVGRTGARLGGPRLRHGPGDDLRRRLYVAQRHQRRIPRALGASATCAHDGPSRPRRPRLRHGPDRRARVLQRVQPGARGGRLGHGTVPRGSGRAISPSSSSNSRSRSVRCRSISWPPLPRRPSDLTRCPSEPSSRESASTSPETSSGAPRRSVRSPFSRFKRSAERVAAKRPPPAWAWACASRASTARPRWPRRGFADAYGQAAGRAFGSTRTALHHRESGFAARSARACSATSAA